MTAGQVNDRPEPPPVVVETRAEALREVARAHARVLLAGDIAAVRAEHDLECSTWPVAG